MKFDRDLNDDGQGKYELRNLRTGQVVTDCGVGDEHEFMVIMLKDINAEAGLRAYAAKAAETDIEWAATIERMADRAGPNSPFCKVPD